MNVDITTLRQAYEAKYGQEKAPYYLLGTLAFYVPQEVMDRLYTEIVGSK